MAEYDFSEVSALVVEDFASFRATLTDMLNKLQVKKVAEATNVPQGIKWCEDNVFDVILCDFNLGKRRNGQHMLEELRHRKMIDHNSLFVMVTAEAGKHVVMATYDCHPDDYLVKPFNFHVLKKRLSTMLSKRDALLAAKDAQASGDIELAIEILTSHIDSGRRHKRLAQQMLAEIYVELDRDDDAMATYRDVLAQREIDWARFGLLRLTNKQGDHLAAKQGLNSLIQESRLFLPAYDELATLSANLEDTMGCQKVLQDAAQVSPKSILRQRQLAQIAKSNGDAETAYQASFAAHKLGEFSFLQSNDDALDCVEQASLTMASDSAEDSDKRLAEMKKVIDYLSAQEDLDPQSSSISNFLNARLCELEGDKKTAKELVQKEEHLLKGQARPAERVQLARLDYYTFTGDNVQAADIAEQLAKSYSDNTAFLKQVDCRLQEPKDEENRALVARLNREGIEAYSAGDLEASLSCFQHAISLFPQHISLRLNRLQTLVAKSRAAPENPVVATMLTHAVAALDRDLDPQHDQYKRFVKLKTQASGQLGGISDHA